MRVTPSPTSTLPSAALPVRVAHRTLIAVTLFSALSAVGGGIGLVITDGLGMPHSFLSGGPFSSFVWPGMILLVVVGGTQTLAVVQLWLRAPMRLLAAAVAGFGVVIWIAVEIGLIGEFSWPQAIYLAAGLMQLAAVYGELGILPINPNA